MTITLPHIFATLPPTPYTPASYWDDNFNTIVAAINGIPSAGITTNAQTGTTYIAQSSDLAKLITFTNGSAIAATLPQAVGSFANPWYAYFYCLGTSTGSVTITPTVSTINGSSDLVLSPGNWAIVVSDGVNYQALVTSPPIVGMTKLSTQTASSSASLDFKSVISGTYNKYLLEFDDIILATNPAVLTIQVSTDNGSTWKSTGYLNNFVGFENGTPTYVLPTTYIQAALSSTSAAPSSGQIWLSNPNSTSNVCVFNGNYTGVNGSGVICTGLIGGYYNTTGTAINAVKLIASTGNIASGVARLYGLAK